MKTRATILLLPLAIASIIANVSISHADAASNQPVQASQPSQAVSRFIQALEKRDAKTAASDVIDLRYQNHDDLIQAFELNFTNDEIRTFKIVKVSMMSPIRAKVTYETTNYNPSVYYSPYTHKTLAKPVLQPLTTSVTTVLTSKDATGWHVVYPRGKTTLPPQSAPQNTDFTGTSVLKDSRSQKPFRPLLPHTVFASEHPTLSSNGFSPVSLQVGHSFQLAVIRSATWLYIHPQSKQYIELTEQPDVGKFRWLGQLTPVTIHGVDAWLDTSRPQMPEVITWHKGLCIMLFGNVSLIQLKDVVASLVSP